MDIDERWHPGVECVCVECVYNANGIGIKTYYRLSGKHTHTRRTGQKDSAEEDEDKTRHVCLEGMN